jgi:3'-phosphoadenosine 5'-phosphosulfate sulfotransferase (PAPS reductase)/FAD synthetase
MVSGGKDSMCSNAVAREIGIPINLVIHGNTRTGIPETTEFVRAQFSSQSDCDFAEADAGSAYEAYVLRKGFFGKGINAHGHSYRILKATPFRKVISGKIRQGKRDRRILLLSGTRKDESANRMAHLQIFRRDPASPNNIWVSLIHNWTAADRDQYLESRNIPINPVSIQLCKSGECMCGTMQSKAQRMEAAVLYPHWGRWLSDLETEARRLHGFGWGEDFPKKMRPSSSEAFQPMCVDCLK